MMSTTWKLFIWSLAAIFAGPELISRAEGGNVFYSVNDATDTLVAINPNTGHVTTIGSLGLDVDFDIDLTFHNGELYGISTHFFTRFSELLKINTTTGAAIRLGNLSVSGSSVPLAEGLASANGKLYAAYTTFNGDFLSRNLGELSLSGSITNGVLLSTSSGAIAEGDAMGASPSGQIFGVDVRAGGQFNDLYRYDPTGNPKAVLVGSYPVLGNGGFGDLAFAGNDLYGIGVVQRFNTLHRIDSTNGQVLSTITFDISGSHRGLAIAPEAASVPEPSSSIVMGSLGILCGVASMLRIGKPRQQANVVSRLRHLSA